MTQPVGFSEDGAKRIADAVRIVENTHPPFRRPSGHRPFIQGMVEGVYTDDLSVPAAGGYPTTATFQPYRGEGDQWSLSGEEITVTNRDTNFSAGNGDYGIVIELNGEWRPVALSRAEGPTNPCCGCPPTQCYDQYESTTPPLLSVDLGDMLCCDGRAGGVKTLRWTGSAWVSPTFWCQPDAGGSSCGTAVFRWSENANPCDTASAEYLWTPVQPPNIYGECSGSYSLITACPDGCSSAQPAAPNPWLGENTCETQTKTSPCTGGGDPVPGWVLVTDGCNCGQSPVPPDRDGTYEGEEVTVSCPGDSEAPPEDVPCTGGDMDEVLWSGDTLSEAGDLLYLPGTIVWVYGTQADFCLGFSYGIQFNGCDPLEVAQSAEPAITWAPGDLTPGDATPPPGNTKYIITSCPSEPCPPDGYVSARWVLVPATGYEETRLELRVGGVVKIRYVMPANRTFCQACLNKMEIEQTGCSWPCANIPEFVCVRPYGGNGATCLPYGQSYTMSVPAMTVSNPAIGAITAGQLSEAAGDYALDIVDSEGMDPRYEANGCRTTDPTCCTWRAPYSDQVTGGPCDLEGGLGWVMQTCDPDTRNGLTAKRFQNYDCAGNATPVLRFGINTYRDDYVEAFGFTGPSVIEWTKFQGPTFDTDGGTQPCAGTDCCTPAEVGCAVGDGGVPYFDPELVSQYGYWLTWTLKEILPDGTLVMRMADADYSGWVTAFPQEIELTPA